jgi:hypothetical protein
MNKALLLFLIAFPSGNTFAARAKVIPSPDKAFVAKIETAKTGESKISIGPPKGGVKFSKSFVSPDGEHGNVIWKADWTANSRFLVFIVEHSGGHSPLMHPIYFWDRRDNQLRMLDYVVGGIRSGFTLRGPDMVRGMRIAAIPLDTRSDDEEEFSISLASAARNYRPPNLGFNRN